MLRFLNTFRRLDYLFLLRPDEADPLLYHLKDDFERGFQDKVKKENKDIDLRNFAGK